MQRDHPNGASQTSELPHSSSPTHLSKSATPQDTNSPATAVSAAPRAGQPPGNGAAHPPEGAATMRGKRRNIVVGSLMLAMFATAMEGTIVATAMPSIVSSLGGFTEFAWVFSLFLLTQTATIPLYGKL